MLRLRADVGTKPGTRDRFRMSLGQLSWRAVGVRSALVLALTVFVWPAFAHAVEVWSTDEEFTYGFLIGPIAVAILWWRRGVLKRSIGRGNGVGLLIVAVTVVVTVVSRRIGINTLAGLAVSPMFIGVVVYLWGWQAGRVV